MSTRITRKRARTDANEDPVDEVQPDSSTPQAVRSISRSRVADDGAGPSDPGDASEPAKDEEFWFEDGTIILHADNVEFRVYRGLLEGHSPVFKDLFAQSHPTRHISVGGEQHSFLCPVVKLSDSAYDLRHFLRRCVPRDAGSLGTTVTPSFAMVSAAVRLGQKYKFTDMHEKALAFLKSHYTDSLDIWLSRGLDWSPDGWSASEAIGVINLAKLTGERSLLPTAFMACAIALRGSLIRGFTREDGSQEHLALRDIGRCLNAQIRLREASVAALFRVLTPTVASACKAPSQCAKTLQKALRGNNVEANVNVMMTGDFLLNTPKSHLKTKDGKSSICKACTAMIKKRDKEENRALWDRLPALLGIKVPEWVKPAAAPAPAATREGQFLFGIFSE